MYNNTEALNMRQSWCCFCVLPLNPANSTPHGGSHILRRVLRLKTDFCMFLCKDAPMNAFLTAAAVLFHL